MSTLLLIVIYIAFIGLGIPDSVFGTAWPAIYADFNLPVSWANFVSLTVSGGTIVSSLMSAKLSHRFGTARVTAASTVLTALALLGFAYSENFFFMWLMAIPLGLGAGAIDTVLNNYVALHYSASHMSFLHCFYGVGVSMSPVFMSMALADNADWRGGYKMIFFVQALIAVLTVVTVPLWKRVRYADADEEEKNENSVSMLSVIKQPKLYLIGAVFIGSCAVEYTCGTWSSTFLVNAKGFSLDAAAKMVTFYYVGITAGRFVSGILANKLNSRQIITAGQIILLAAICLLFVPLKFIAGIALFLMGFGNGPVIPNMIHLTPSLWGFRQSQTAMGLQISLAYVGILAAPSVFGLIAQHVDISLFPVYLAAFYMVMLAATIITWKKYSDK